MALRASCINSLFALALLGASLGRAEEFPSQLTLRSAIQLGISRNPILAAAESEIHASEGDRIAAGRRPAPSFSLEFEDLPIKAHPGPFFRVQGITSRVDVELETGRRRRLRIEAANKSLDAQRLLYSDQIRMLRLQIQKAFFETILAKSNLDNSKLVLEQAERMIALNRVRFQQGDISALDLNRVEMEALKFRDEVFQAELALRNAKSSLLALLNAPDLSLNIDVVGALPVDYRNQEPELPPHAPLNELIQMALKQRPDLAARIEEQGRAATETQLQRAIRAPNVTIGGGYKSNLGENALVFGATVPLSIFNRNQGEIIRAEAQRDRAAHLTDAAQKSIHLEVQKAFNAAEIHKQRVEHIKTQQLKRAEEAGQIAFQSYNLGGGALLDYLDAQRTYRDALRLYNQALFDQRISLYELSSSIGLGAH
jgi:outer membrane protein, heavy metal efflux system